MYQSIFLLFIACKKAELTDKQNEMKIERAIKRRQLAHEKREKDKRDTLDRLLKKQDNKRGSKVCDR